MTKWPGPLVKLYLGQLTSAAVLASIEDATGRTKKRQICQANFYGGMWALRQDAKEEAMRLLKLAANDCYKSAIEWRAAVGEIKALEIALTAPPSVPPAETKAPAAPAESTPPDVATDEVTPKEK